VANIVPANVTQQASTIVSQAASVLDDEMARGVLAARQANPRVATRAPDATSSVLRQVHDVLDQVAAVWPSVQGAPAKALGASQSAVGDVGAMAELKPTATVRAGQRAIISMTLSNSESRSVHLIPAVTDLLGSRGGRIPADRLDLSPNDVRLEPGEQKTMEVGVNVPSSTPPGSYSGVLVIAGVDYLRALVAIEIA
jgi:hypothetical protein